MLSDLVVNFALSVAANGLDRGIADLSTGSPLSLAIEDTAAQYGSSERRRVDDALREWAASGAFVALVQEVRGGARADIAGRFVESFRQRGGYHEVDPERERTEIVLRRFVEALTHRTLESGDLRPLVARVDGIAEEQRQVAADVTAVRQQVVDEASPAADWRRVAEHSRLWIDRVQDTIGGTVRLPRQAERDAATAVLAEVGVAVLVGESGTGKSAIAKALAQANAGPVVWASAQRLTEWTLTEWRAHLGLHHSVSDLVAAEHQDRPLLVLDGLDRLYESSAFEHVAEWLRTVGATNPGSPWRVLASCIPEAWDRVQDPLAQQRVAFPPTSRLDVGTPDRDELKSVWAEYPELNVLQSRDHLSIVLRPKVLDLLARNRAALGDAALFGESDAARLFWAHEVAPQSGGIARAHAARSLATVLADRLSPSLREATLF